MAATLSRKAKKKLEKVVLRRKLKVNRKNLLADLKKCQLEPDQLDLLHSTSSMQTKGLKRFLHDDSFENAGKLTEIDKAEQCLDASILIGRKRRRVRQQKPASVDSSSSEDTDAISTDNETASAEDADCSGNADVSAVSVDSETDSCDTIVYQYEPPKSEPAEKVVENDEQESSDKAIEAPKRHSEPAIFVPVIRDPKIEEARLKLPIIGEEQNIVETIRYNDIVVVSGETGSGKTTQIPQFLYEAGYTLKDKMIGVTEPRRVAAVSMCERVASELNLSSDEVSYQIRFSGNASSKTQIKFMTDGVLLRECQQDFLLSKYSVIIIDEAHERSIFSDILIGFLSRIVPMRAKRKDPLKLVIMSATLKLSDFTDNKFLFKQTPPLINIETRQFPVSVKFSTKTPADYLQAAYRKVCSIHSKMPRGGILVFVTSQMDVKMLCKKLRQKYPKTREGRQTKLRSTTQELHDWSGDESESDEDAGVMTTSNSPLHCLGLYAMLPLEKQRLVFKEPPEGTRLCVIATNVAETSITIPNIKYVVDSGKEKTKVYDLVTGVSRFKTVWTSKSSAEQRMGRAGRMGPGYCFRLFSSAVFTNDFPDHAEPRILQKPVEDLVLQMKSMNIDNVVNFPFPTRPSLEALESAEKKLITLGALDDSKFKEARFAEISKAKYSSRLTPLGRAMACFAVSARCAKMIALSPPKLIPHVIALVSALTVQEMFLKGNQWHEIKKKWSGHSESKLLGDFMLMIRAVVIASTSGCSNKVCRENGLRTKAMLEIDKLRKQLTKEVNSNLTQFKVEYDPILKKPTQEQSKIIRQLLLSSYCDHVARKIPNSVITIKDPSDPNKTIKKKLRHAYECSEIQGPVYISSDSILKGSHPGLVIYKESYQGDKEREDKKRVDKDKTYMRDIAVIDPNWLEVPEEELLTGQSLMKYLHDHQDSSVAKLG